MGSPTLRRGLLIFWQIMGGQDDNHRLWIFSPDLLCEDESTLARKLDIHKNKVRGRFVDVPKGFLSIPRFSNDNLWKPGRKQCLQCTSEMDVILNNEYLKHQMPAFVRSNSHDALANSSYKDFLL